ncbi:MAG TPA: ferritin [Armatimonadota bacterium]|jgi:ferritin
MLISKTMSSALSTQVGNEFLASLQYVAIAAYFDGESLPELAARFYTQADEERMHAMKLLKYVVGAGGSPEIPSIPAPQSRFGSAVDAVQCALDHELRVTAQINELASLAKRESDHLSDGMLQWFVTEQLEEVSGMETLLKMVKRAGESGLLMVEDFLARTKAAAPAPTGGPAA